jgi:hypothetical protein
MELQIVISANEVVEHQCNYRKHICGNPLIRKSELTWVAEQIVKKLSLARSMRGEWAVVDTLIPAVVRALSPFALSEQPAKELREAELACKKQNALLQ